jgi:hypothetical protein
MSAPLQFSIKFVEHTCQGRRTYPPVDVEMNLFFSSERV